MPEITITMQNKEGLHGRPAARFIDTARKYTCAIQVTHKDKTVNAKSILQLLTLGVFGGSTITIHAEGDDADMAISSLQTLIESKFGEAQ
jgi:phosphocarrier protein HPr